MDHLPPRIITTTTRPRLGQTILLLVATACCLQLTAEEIPYGHPDFYPSPERPAGLQGDGSGLFPGASPSALKWDIASRKGIIWATTLPSFGFSSPIVVGDKVFVTAEFNNVVCIDARSGKTLWITDCDTIDTVAGDQAEAVRKQWNEYWQFHSEGHAVCFELAYLHWKIDNIETAKAGGTISMPKKGYNAGGKVNGKHGSNLIYPGLLTQAERQALSASFATIDDAELAALKERRSAIQAIQAEQKFSPSNSAYIPTGCPHARSAKDKIKEWEQRFSKSMDNLRQEYGLFLEFWNGWMNAFPTPVSDGRHVYVQLSHTQVACLDLDGAIVWMKAFPEVMAGTGSDVGQNFSASPVLDDDRLYTIFGGDRGSFMTIRCQDTATGEVLWSLPDHGLNKRHSFNQIRLIKAGDERFLVSGSGLIVNAVDGKPLNADTQIYPHQIPPPLAQGDTAYLFSGGGMTGARENGWYAVRVVPGEPTATLEYLWAWAPKKSSKNSAGPSWQTLSKLVPKDKLHDNKNEMGDDVGGVVIDGTYWMDWNKKGVTAVDLATGQMSNHKLTIEGTREWSGTSGHAVLAGEHIITSGKGNNYAWYQVFHASDPTKRLAINRLGGEVKRRLLLQEMPLDEVLRMIREHHYDPQDTLINHSTVYPQGDRLYIRTKDSVFCIGDADKPYHSPAGAPAAAKTE